MPTYAVFRKSDQQEVYRYEHALPVPWDGMDFATHDHIECDLGPEQWWLYPGPFKDRLGIDALAIATSTHPVCVAANEMLSDRLYIDLKNQKTIDLLGMLVQAGQPSAVPYFPGSGPMTPSKVNAILREPAKATEVYGGPSAWTRITPPRLVEQFTYTHMTMGLRAAILEDGTVQLEDGRWTTLAALAANNTPITEIV
jgi:hypothetical protein